MKIPKTFLFLFAMILALGAFTPHHASAQVSVSFFYDTLSPYGEWVSDPDYGYVWHPTNVDDNWAPYTDGYWAYTDAGWTWVSYEDYGGVVYHYGRWAHRHDEGWVWVPGETWAPAWVSWRSNDDYVGWAPLPPEARWHADIGFGGGVDAHFDIGPGFYSFVGVRDFGAPALGPVIVNREQNVTIINNTTNITNITTNNTTVYNGGPNYNMIAARSARPIPTLKLVRQTDAGAIRAANGKILSRQSGNQLMVLAPHVTAPTGKMPAPPHVARTLTASKADHGWDVVKDPTERASMESKFKASGKGESLSARPVKAEDLKIVSDKVKTGTPTKSFSAEDSATPPARKGKNKKAEDLSALENAPATGDETPKARKSKKSSEDYSGTEDETPAPKIKKSKKAPTPDDYGDAGSAKHSKYEDSDSKPFLNGDDTDKPKKSSSEDEYKSKETEGSDLAPKEDRTPKNEGEGSKGEKKSKKGEGQPSPAGY
jgi:hypothetical protein